MLITSFGTGYLSNDDMSGIFVGCRGSHGFSASADYFVTLIGGIPCRAVSHIIMMN